MHEWSTSAAGVSMLANVPWIHLRAIEETQQRLTKENLDTELVQT